MSTPAFNLPTSGATDFGAEERAMKHYREEGTRRALALPNRGPVRFDENGKLAADIIATYREYGFYVFTGMIGADELADIERDVATILDRAPVAPDAKVDQHGKPAMGSDCEGRTFRLVKPLSDPLGGTSANFGRHQIKMYEPEVPQDAPDWVMQVLLGPLQHSDACLRYYGNPQLLAIAAGINGEDFTPFNEVVWVKHPRLGGSVSWHQDGWTHWESPELDDGTHGFNSMLQLYGCDATNGLWVVPGSHKLGKLDLKTLRDTAGSDRLENAVPLICEPGDIAITNRQAIHGSFANTSDQMRVSITAGFHRRRSVLGITSGGVHNPISEYDDDYIRNRSRLIMYAIDARRQTFPDETSYEYQPLAKNADQYRWSPQAKADIHDYNLQDIGI
jgi:hypothetical protein